MGAVAVVMPRLGMTMEEGTVVEWVIPVGDAVRKGAVLLVIETEKSEVEVEAIVAGFVRHVYVEPGETVACGTLLAALTGSADEAFDVEEFAARNRSPEPARTAVSVVPEPSARRSPAPRATSGRRPVAPAARALARELGIEPDEVEGTGPGGRVTRQDVESWSAARENLVDVAAGVRLECLREGEGEPVLFLPGLGTDVSSFAPQTAALSASHAVIGLNPRGVGHSDAPELVVYDVATAAADAAAVLGEPAHIVGASLGAATAIELALTAPERVRSLTLVTPLLQTSARLLAVADAWYETAASAGPWVLARVLAPWLFSERFLADTTMCARTLRGLETMLARVPANTIKRQAAGAAAWSGTRTEADLKTIGVPTLLLVAQGDLLTPGGEALGRSISGATTIMVPDAGHALAIEAGDRVTAALIEHLSR